MKITDHTTGANLCGPLLCTFEVMVATGEAVDTTAAARAHFGAHPVAVEAGVYDRFISWDGATTRRLALSPNEWERLDNLLAASCSAAFGSGGPFVCRAIDSSGQACQEFRHVLSVTNVGGLKQPRWLITTCL